MEGQACGDDGIVGGIEAKNDALGKGAGSLFHGTVHQFGACKQETGDLLCLGFLIDVYEGFEFAQMMGVAQGVLDTREREVGLEVIVNDDAIYHRCRHIPSLLAHTITGEPRGGSRMQPLGFAPNTKTSFVQMPDWGMVNEVGNMTGNWGQFGGFCRTPCSKTCRAERTGTKEITHHL